MYKPDREGELRTYRTRNRTPLINTDEVTEPELARRQALPDPLVQDRSREEPDNDFTGAPTGRKTRRVRRRRLTRLEQAQFDRDYQGSAALDNEYWEPWWKRGFAAQTRPDPEEALESDVLLARARGRTRAEGDAEKALASFRARFDPAPQGGTSNSKNGLLHLADKSASSDVSRLKPSRDQDAGREGQESVTRAEPQAPGAEDGPRTVNLDPARGVTINASGQMARNAPELFGAWRETKVPPDAKRDPLLTDGEEAMVFYSGDPEIGVLAIPSQDGLEPFNESSLFDHVYDRESRVDGASGDEGLRAVGEALRKTPTPGQDQPATPQGVSNDATPDRAHIGPLQVDGEKVSPNKVKSFTVPNPNPDQSDYVVNYTVNGEHNFADGIVARYAKKQADDSITIRSFGRGDAPLQFVLGEVSDALKLFGKEFRPPDSVWKDNAKVISDSFRAGKEPLK